MGFILRSLNIAVFAAFWLSFLRPGVPVVEYILDTPLIGNLRDSDESLLHAFADFFVPGVLLYFVLRFVAIERWAKVSPTAHTQLLIANALIVSVFFLAASDPSLGLPIAVFFGLPAIIFSLTGTTTLLFEAAANHETANPGWRQPVSGTEIKFALVIALAGAFILGGPVFLSSNGGVQLIAKNQEWMKEKCPSAGAKVIRPFVGPLFIDESTKQYTSRWTISDSSLSVDHLEAMLVKDVGVAQVEWSYLDPKGKAIQYRVYRKVGSEYKYESVDSVSASYVVRAKSIVEKEVSENRSIKGFEISIVDIATDQTTATLRFFMSRYPRLVCGQGYGTLDLGKFFRQAFGRES
jgi:hypothetical protein